MGNADDSMQQQRLERLLNYHAADPGNVPLLCDCVASALQLGRIETARALLDAGLEQFPDDDILSFQCATLEIATDNPARARDLLQGLLARGIDNGGVRYNLAFALALLGEMQPALTVLTADWDRVCAAAPRAPLLKARLQHHLNEVEAGIATLAAFLRVFPHDAEANGDLALLLIDADDYAGANLCARLALEDGDGDEHYGALVARGMVALSQSELDVARSCFNDTVHRREEAGRSRLGLGLCELAEGQPAQAEPFLISAVQQLPLFAPAWVALAWAYLGQQRLDAAEATLARAPMAADNAEIQGLLAVAAVMRGDTAMARAYIEAAERLPGPVHNATYARSLLLLQSGDSQAAAALLQNIMAHPAANHAGGVLLAKWQTPGQA